MLVYVDLCLWQGGVAFDMVKASDHDAVVAEAVRLAKIIMSCDPFGTTYVTAEEMELAQQFLATHGAGGKE